MRWLRRFRQRRRRDADLAAELESYLQHEADDWRARGKCPAEARHLAQQRLGNTTQIREEVYRMNSIGALESITQDVRYALRLLWNSPGFTTVAVLLLVLGIGLNTAMFSVINTVLLHSLPYPHPEELVRLGHQGGEGNVTIPEYMFWKEHSRVFSSVAGYRPAGERRLDSTSGHEWISTLQATTGFLRTLGVPPALGREFNDEETQSGGPQSVLLSDGLWRRSFGADPAILGRAITLDGVGYTVVGVLPAGLWLREHADAIIPIQAHSGNLLDGGTNTSLIARLSTPLTLERARAETALLNDSFWREHSRSGQLQPLDARLTAISYRDWLVGSVRTNLLLLFGATGLLLLIACANLATLLLTRFASRGKEFAVRLALGGTRRRLLMQSFIENLLIVSLGVVAGLAAADILLHALIARIPFDLPSSTPIRLDPQVLLFTAGIAVATAICFTLIPWLGARHLDVNETLKSAGRTGAGAIRARTRNFLVVSEVALSTTLLISAGLLIQSLHRLSQERLGFTPAGLITFQTPLAPERQKDPVARQNFTRALFERLQTMPGVQSVAITSVLPLDGYSNLPTQRTGHAEQGIGGMEVRAVSPAYFEMLGIPVRQGRSFTGADAGSSVPVVIVNEALAKAWWPEGHAIGDRVTIGRFHDRQFIDDLPREVIGVVGDTKTFLTWQAIPTVFVPLAQSDNFPPANLAWVLRFTASAGQAEEIRRAIAEVDPAQRIRKLRPLAEVVAATTAGTRFNASLFTIFAAVALVLAMVGVYGLLSFLVAQRRREIGTRIALGASRADILTIFLREGVVLTAVGLAAGLLGAYALNRWFAALLYGVRAHDVPTFAAASALLFLAAIVAIYLPARSATKTDPMVALRYE